MPANRLQQIVPQIIEDLLALRTPQQVHVAGSFQATQFDAHRLRSSAQAFRAFEEAEEDAGLRRAAERQILQPERGLADAGRPIQAGRGTCEQAAAQHFIDASHTC